MPIRQVVFDFDGTCTEIPASADAYVRAYLAGFSAQVLPIDVNQWNQAMSDVRSSSPRAGWTIGGAPSAPAAADPYILAGETAALIARKHRLKAALPDLHTSAYDEAQAKFRGDVAEVFAELVGRGMRVWFISNSRTAKIEHRLDDLLRSLPDVREQVHVVGDARKFAIQEIPVESALDPRRRSAFEALPAVDPGPRPGRPVYLRRGSYFDALCRVLGDDGSFEETLVCGDIWELDLAMPARLGCSVHLIRRQPPFETYEYESAAVAELGVRGGFGDELASLLTRL